MWGVADILHRELILFAVTGFLIGGVDDLMVDLIWSIRMLWRLLTGRTGDIIHRRDEGDGDGRLSPARIAFFIPLWDEAGVAGSMLANACACIAERNAAFFIGCYPNDPATIAEVQAASLIDSRVKLVICGRPGPTTKADCLNAVWRAMLLEENRLGLRFTGIVLHDAEDMIHPGEVALYSQFLKQHDFVQIPVIPIADPRFRWISGHYCDEFAEAHAKSLVVREAIGAGIPAAGVGCAFSRKLLSGLAAAGAGAPFNPDCLTEDYELGLMVKAMGGKSSLIRLPARDNRSMVAVRAHFPTSFDAAVRQKARWMAGIALSGWDRLGWQGGIAEFWMRLRDRRAPLAALVLVAAYLAFLIAVVRLILHWAYGIPLPRLGPALTTMLFVSQFLLLWRLGVRACFVGLCYGWREALLSIPRNVVANVISIFAARRAIGIYVKQIRTGQIVWDKTAHIFPTLLADR
jgi:adsorption protein B